VATVLADGARRVVWFCVGVIFGDITWLLLSLSGLALVAQEIPSVFIAIKWAGVSYLIYLAVKIWRASPSTDDSNVQSQQRGIVARILAGYSITIGNPKAMLFNIALLPTLVSPRQISTSMILSLIIAVVMVLATVLAVYVLAAEKTRSTLTNSQSLRKFNRMTASALGGAAVWITAK
jgi:threonine/homoserine/homoserine lactone efflux protein